jgi:chromosome segregation ATPase
VNAKTMRKVAIVLAAIVIAGTCLIDAGAQRRRKRKRTYSKPRITNPAITPPSSDSTSGSAESQASGTENQSSTGDQAAKTDDPDSMRRTISTLSSQVDKLTEKISQMEQSQRSLVDLERLSRAEQRAESLRAQLRDVQAKENDLQARAEDIEYALQPQNIERYAGGMGTTHPEEVRDQRRKQLEGEKARVRAQLDTLAQSRARLEQAIADADTEVDRIRQRLDAADRAAIENSKTKVQSDEGASQPSQPYPTPTPTPYPPQ